jgi:hypothetical protein
MDVTRYCQSCGAALAPHGRFCGACGHPVATTATEPPAGGQPPLPPPPWAVEQAAPPATPPTAFAGAPPPYAQPAGGPPPGVGQAPPKKKARTGLVITCGCLALVAVIGLLAVGAWLWFKMQSDPGLPSLTGTDSGDAPIAAVADGPARGALLFSDDFSDPNSGWDSSEGVDAATIYESGQYHIIVNKPDWVVWGNPYAYFTDSVLEVDATQVAGTDDNGFGVLLRYVDEDNFYRFEISGDGYYSFDRLEDNAWTTLINWTPSDAIRQGNSTNTLTVVCAGDRFTFYVNGVYLDEYRDSVFPAGDIGLQVGTIQEAPVHIAFDNLKVWSLP